MKKELTGEFKRLSLVVPKKVEAPIKITADKEKPSILKKRTTVKGHQEFSDDSSHADFRHVATAQVGGGGGMQLINRLLELDMKNRMLKKKKKKKSKKKKAKP